MVNVRLSNACLTESLLLSHKMILPTQGVETPCLLTAKGVVADSVALARCRLSSNTESK